MPKKPEVKTEQAAPETNAKKYVLMQGNEAVARGALDAGVNFYAGYPITPSTEVAEIMSEEQPKRGGVFIQMEDEIASIMAVVGASLAGARAMTATSGPGFSLMQEGIGYAKITETPCLIVNVMRGGPGTGLPTKPSQGDIMQTRWGSHGDAPAIVLYPNSVAECYSLTIRAMNLAEKYRNCVILLLDEVLGHMREGVSLPDLAGHHIVGRIKPNVPPEWYKHYDENQKYLSPLASYGEGYRFHVTGLAHDAHGFPTNKPNEIGEMMKRLKRKITYNIRDLVQIESFEMEGADICVFAAGSVSRSAKEAVVKARRDGIKVGLLRPLTIWPFPEEAVKQMLKETHTVIVPEMNEGQLVHEIERLAVTRRKIVKINRVDGEQIAPTTILTAIKEAL